jgi:drug/metabolite transporter (DMT)-like permease
VSVEPIGATEPDARGSDPGQASAARRARMGAASGPARLANVAALDLTIAAALWGGLYVVSAATFAAIPPVTLSVLRLAVGVATLSIAFRGDLGFGQTSTPRVLGAGLIVAVTMTLQFVGTSLTGAAEGALLTTTTPAFVLLFGAALDRQRVAIGAWVGVAFALAGVAAIASRDRAFGGLAGPVIAGVPAPLVGDVLLVGAAAAWALFSHVGKPLVASVGAFRAILQASVVGIVLLVPLVPVELSATPLAPPSAPSILAVLYLGVFATALAWSLWYRGFADARASVSAAAFFAQPVVGATLGVILLGERLDGTFLAGALAIGVGVLAIVGGASRLRRSVGRVALPGTKTG